MAHYMDERELRRLNREQIREEEERKRRLKEEIRRLQSQREQFIMNRTGRRELESIAQERVGDQHPDYEDAYMTQDEYYLSDNPDSHIDSLIDDREYVRERNEGDKIETSQTCDIDRERAHDRSNMYRESTERERDTYHRNLTQLDRNERHMKEKEESRRSVVQHNIKENKIYYSKDNEQRGAVYEHDYDENEIDSSCAKMQQKDYSERQSVSQRAPDNEDESLVSTSKEGDMLNVLDREINELDRRLSMMHSDTRSLLERSTDKFKTARDKWDRVYTDRPEINRMPINTGQGKQNEIEEGKSKDRRREESNRREIYTGEDKRIDYNESVQPDFNKYESDPHVRTERDNYFSNETRFTRRKLEYDNPHKQIHAKQGYKETNKTVLPELDGFHREMNKHPHLDYNPAPLETNYEYISGYNPYPEADIKHNDPYGYVCKREFTGQILPEVRHIDRTDKTVTERRMRKEQMLKAQEEELKRKEIELQEREHWLEYQEQMELERERVDPYEQLLDEKEQKMKLKLEELRKKEQRLRERESKIQQHRNGQESIVPKLEKESTNEQKDVTKQEADAKKEIETKDVKEVDASTQIDVMTTSSRKDMGTQTDESIDGTIQIKTDLTTSTPIQDKPFYFPKFSVFSGEEPKPKNESSFEEWKYEVNCIRRDDLYKDAEVAQAIRKSLKGQAKKVLLPMGTSATVSSIMDRLEGVFGNVATGESILQEFYTATQKSDESVTAWGLRLEEILQKAVDKGHVRLDEKNDMLKTKFWRSLRSDRLKTATRIHYETMSSFELLRKKVRAEEYEMKVSSGIQHQPTRAENKYEEKEDPTAKMNVLLDRLSSLEKQMKEMKAPRKFVFNKRNYNQNTQPKTTEKPTETNTKPKQLN